jgi:hypothetical protein
MRIGFTGVNAPIVIGCPLAIDFNPRRVFTLREQTTKLFAAKYQPPGMGPRVVYIVCY